MDEPPLRSALRQRLSAVERRLSAACRRAGRARSDVTLVAVTKTVAAEVAAELGALGVVHLGESRPQELWRKTALLPASTQWHLIGHLQRNKIEQTLPLVHLIHSADSLRLLAALEETAAKQGRTVSVLIEVNASREENKQGFALEEVPGLSGAINRLRHVYVRGLMTMAAFEADPENCRPTFAALRQLREHWRTQLLAPHALEHLSMGMSNDFEVAVEEGATLVRLGTILFENLAGDQA